MSEPTTQTPVPEAAEAPAPAEAPKPAEQKPAGLTFKQRAELTKKKYEYINGDKKMDKVAAEEQARKDLGLPALSEADKEEAGKPNIFERIMKSKLFVTLGLAKLLSGKKEEEKTTEAPSKEEAGLKEVPTEPQKVPEGVTATPATDQPVAAEKEKEVKQV